MYFYVEINYRKSKPTLLESQSDNTKLQDNNQVTQNEWFTY